MKTTLAAILGTMVGLMMGCSSEEWEEQAMHGDEASMSRGGPRDDATRLQEDPVCGRTVSPWESVSESYDGQTYYFHNEECAKNFRENPQAYFPAKDPVCGMSVNPKTAMYTEEYDHRKYYFDTKECAQRFKDNPHAYMPGGDDRPGFKEVR